MRPADKHMSGGCAPRCAVRALLAVLCWAIFLPAPMHAAAEPSDKKRFSTTDTSPLYSRVIVEDFESSPYGAHNLVTGTNTGADIQLTIETQFPAQTEGSARYLVVRARGVLTDMLSIIPGKKLMVRSLCRSISVWVYGMNTGGSLSMTVRDMRDARHRIYFGVLNFLGWKELTAAIPDEALQTSTALAQVRELEIERINYQRGTNAQRSETISFYLDDISARVRPEYKDTGRKEW